ncbi:MAG: DNA mismatch repair protein MutS, partial [Treponema sp.]|nr:DNA mismatch repair protein MutS [Treponema sp.]
TSWPAGALADEFSKELGRTAPRELLLPQSLSTQQTVQNALQTFSGLSVSYYPDWDFNAATAYKKLTAQFKTMNLHAFGLTEDAPEIPPAGFLLDYLEKTTNTTLAHITALQVYRDNDYLIIDDSSRRNLELVANLRDGSAQYSLLESVNYAKTAMGNRMLRSWLQFPLTDAQKIFARQNHVALFVENRPLLTAVQDGLSAILDIERLAGRIAMEKAHPKDVQALRHSLDAWQAVHETLSRYDFSAVPLDDARTISDMIFHAVTDDPPTMHTAGGGVIKAGWSHELDHWRGIHDNFDRILAEYEKEERETTGISTLRIKHTNASGYFIEVSKGKLAAVPQHFIMRRALVNGDRYTTARLQELEHELTESGTRILELERSLYGELRVRLGAFVPYLLQVAGEIAYTDVAAAFAESAVLNGWVRPDIDASTDFTISAGRHPVVEKHLPTGTFVPNDTAISAQRDADSKSFALITGPNMAGKSTYLRQNALIAILAQTGSFVPAQNAHIGIVDKIFCRVGASDNLAHGESTFLVEMTETAHILRSATERSLVIMDEVGRGTSTEDGLSIAWAVSEYLLNHVRCKTLFATHYHELTRLVHPSLALLCMGVAETDGTVVFLRSVQAGTAENSYGIHVAKLAGIPAAVIARANEILSHIQSLAQERPLLDGVLAPPAAADVPSATPPLPGLFSDEEIILDEILSSDPDTMTPLQALNALVRWKRTLMAQQ